MRFGLRVLNVLALVFFAHVTTAEAGEPSAAVAESVSCYQNGQLLLKTQERIREFRAMGFMSQITEINLGQINETIIRIYATERSGVVCVVTSRK
jgi:hypothetical protein